MDDPITLIGENDFRGQRLHFGIKRADRRAHMYLIGKTGTGKSTLIRNLIRQDIANGYGCALLDPHGDLVEQVLRSVPERRQSDLVYFDVTDPRQALAFNPLEISGGEDAALAASGLISAFKKMWREFWGPRMEYILRNTLLALLEWPGSTLLDIPRMFNDPSFRSHVLTVVTNTQVKDFWLKEYASYSPYFRAEAAAPIQNKVGEFLVNPILRRIVGEAKSSFDLHRVINEGKILLVNLSKGKIGEDAAALLGGMLVTKISLAALARARIPEAQRRDFYLYVDEFPSFTTTSFAGMLSEMRKYRLCLTLAHQYLSQIEENMRDAILANVGTLISFRIGLPDAELLEKEFHPELSVTDLISLPNHHNYLKLMIDGVVSRPFSAVTLRK